MLTFWKYIKQNTKMWSIVFFSPFSCLANMAHLTGLLGELLVTFILYIIFTLLMLAT